MESIIEEGFAKAKVTVKEVVDRKMPVFYNPVMKKNRDFSLIVLDAMDKEDLKIGDPLAGSGIRSLRMLAELPEEKIKVLYANDIKESFVDSFEDNLRLNNLLGEKVKIFNLDANIFMLSNRAFDYLDIDPFGSPNPFIDNAIMSMKNKGILAVTATDTSALSGSYPKACIRKYWAIPLRNEFMHEFGIRILARKLQMMGAQHEKALIPLFSYASEHYMRIFFEVRNGRSAVDAVLAQHAFHDKTYGPAWTGQLWDSEFVERMRLSAKKLLDTISPETIKLLEQVNEECKIGSVGFYDVHRTARKLKSRSIPKIELIINEVKALGIDATRTHFSPTGIRTIATEKEFEKAFKKAMKAKK